MSQDRSRTVIFIVLAALFLIALCVVAIIVGRLFLQREPGQTQAPDLVYTAAAQTVEAKFTQDSSGVIDAVPTQTSAPVLPTNTAVVIPPTSTAVPPTNPPPPTATSLPPTATPVLIPCDRASFVKDVTYPDNADVPVSSTFVKTWRLINNGSCTWTSGYALVFVSGDAMSGPATSQLTTGTVPPGGMIDISVTLKAPDKVGTYRGDWKLRNPAGALFGIGNFAEKSFWVQIDAVIPMTPTPTTELAFDFISQGPNAAWKNATKSIPWGDPGDDTPGVAAEATNRVLDNGKTYPRLLATFPEKVTDGLIRGVYPAYKVKTGDHFRTILGLKDGCDEGKVRYILSYLTGSGEVVMGEWIETCDDKVTTIDIDLTALVGQSLQFVLTAKAEGSPTQDYSYWVLPRIER